MESLTKFFYIDKKVNKTKLDILNKKRFQLRIYKNYISEIIYKEIKEKNSLKELSLYDLIKKETKHNIPYINNKDMEYGIKQIYSNYLNKIETINTKSEFKIIKRKLIFYKKNIYSKTDKNIILKKKDSLRLVKKSIKKSQLSIILNYMLNKENKSYEEWKEEILWINNNENIKKEIKDFYKKINYYLEKYQNPEKFSERNTESLEQGKNTEDFEPCSNTEGFGYYPNTNSFEQSSNTEGFVRSTNRLLKLIEIKKLNNNKKYWKSSIKINKLSFKSQSRIKLPIINLNKNKFSIIDGFISLGGYDYYEKELVINKQTKLKKGELILPIKLHSKYHFNSNKRLKDIKLFENLKQGEKETYSQVYNITYNEFDLITRIDLIKDEEENLEEFINIKDKYIGCDINTKNNLFYLSNNTEYNYDKKIMEEFLKYIKSYDKKKNKKLNTQRQKLKQEKVQKRLQNHILEIVSKMIKDIKNEGYNHLILEDIKLTGNKFRVKNKEYDIGYGRLFSFINITTLKDKIRRIGHKQGIKVSFVPRYYTSKKCSNCGYIDNNNRKTQEEFLCKNCKHEENRDYNSSKNIKEILILDVLKSKFLKYDEKYKEYNVKKNIRKFFIIPIGFMK